MLRHRLLIIVLLLGACGETQPQDTGNGDEATVQNRRRNGWTAERAWRLDHVRVVGRNDGDTSDMFGQVVDIALDGAGRVWVADGLNQELKVFGPDGALVRKVGRKGPGPMEFGSIAGMDWDPAGNLWVLDGGNSRFAVYDTAGTLLATHLRSPTVTMTPWPGGFNGNGEVVDLGAIRRTAGSRSFVLVRGRPDALGRDSIQLPALEERTFGKLTSGDATHRSVREAPVPFMPTQLWAVDRNGSTWTAHSNKYRLERRGSTGQVDRIVELDNKPPSIGRAEKDAILRNYEWFERQGGRLDRSLIPDEHPDLLNFFFDDTGHMWVAPTYSPSELPSFDIFDPAGRFLGRVIAPVTIVAAPAPVVRAGTMAALSRDGNGVDSVVLFRLTPPGSAPAR